MHPRKGTGVQNETPEQNVAKKIEVKGFENSGAWARASIIS